MKSIDVVAGATALANEYNLLRDDAYASSWLLPHQQTSPDLTLKVEEGTAYIDENIIIYAGGNSPSFTAPASNPRIDILSLDKTGTLIRTAGAENASPVAPTLPAGNIPIAHVFNRVGQTSVKDVSDGTNGYIYKDARNFLERHTPLKVNVNTTASSLVDGNTTTEKTLFSTTVPANTLLTSNVVKIEAYLSDVGLNNGDTLTLRLKYGATTIATISMVKFAAPLTVGLTGKITANIVANGATNAQKCGMSASFSNPDFMMRGDAASASIFFAMGEAYGTATEDSTADKTLTLTAQYTSTAASNDLTAEYWIVTKIV